MYPCHVDLFRGIRGMTMDQPIRVWLIDTYRSLSDSVTPVWGREHAIDFVGTSTHFSCFMSAAHQQTIHVVVINVTTDGLDAYGAIREIKRRFPVINVVVMEVEPCDDAVLQWIEAGANGYLFKRATREALLQTIQAVHQGQTPCSPRLVALVFARISELAAQRAQRDRSPHVHLTPREREVLQCLAHGTTNNEIAYELGIAMETVKRHLSNIFDKLGVRSRREVRQWLEQHNRLAWLKRRPPSRSSSRVA